MGMLRYLRMSIWDLLMCFGATFCFAYVMCTGFNSTRVLQAAPWAMALVCALVTVWLFVSSYRTLAAVLGSLALVVATAVAVAVCWQNSGAASILDDVVGNNALFVLICVISGAMVFLLSRRKATTLLLLAFGTIMCAAIEYLYFLGHVIPTLAFVCLVGGLYAYRNYQVNLLASDSDSASFGSATTAALIISAVALAAGAGIFLACIAPLDPPNLVIKLLTVHMRQEEIEVTGVSQNATWLNELIISQNPIDTPEDLQDPEDQQQNMDDTQEDQDQETPDAGSAMNIDDTGDDSGHAISTAVLDFTWVLVVLGVILLVAAVILTRRWLRRRRYRGMMGLDPGPRIEALYLYFMGVMGKLRMPQVGSNTLAEYLVAARGSLQGFERTDGDPGFDAVTEAYAAWKYGKVEPDEGQLSLFEDYYQHIHTRARKKAGFPRYIVLFFRI